MDEILNLALKKNIFEGLINKTSNEIPIKKNNWWKKRLIDENTGRYKDFKVVSASSGSADKVYFEIKGIRLVDENFIITVQPIDFKNNFENNEEDTTDSDVDITPETIEPEIIEPVTVNPVVVDTVGNVTTVSTKGRYYLSPEVRETIVKRFITKFNEEMKETVEYDVKEETIKIINSFCNNKDVFVVNMPFVTIRNNGQIIGYHGGRRLIADRDADVRIDFKKYELVKYDTMSDAEFLLNVNNFLNNLLKNSYVFINKSLSKFETTTNGELILKIFVISKKKYLFGR